MTTLLKKLIFPNNYVNRLSINYIKTQLKIFLYKFNIYSKYSLVDNIKIPNYKKNVVTYKILSSGEYEKKQINILKKYLTKDSYFFDIGTNNGFFSYYFEKKLRNHGKIFAFDAMKSIIILNNKYKKENNLYINFKYLVFGSKKEKKSFNYYSDDLNYIDSRDLSLVKKKNKNIFKNNIFQKKLIKSKKVYLNTISFDEYVKKNKVKKVSFLKIDIDGSELDFLKGSINTIKKFKPYILCEIDNEVIKKKFKYNKVEEILRKYYHIFKLNNNKLIKINKFSLKNCNGYYFFKKKIYFNLAGKP